MFRNAATEDTAFGSPTPATPGSGLIFYCTEMVNAYSASEPLFLLGAAKPAGIMLPARMCDTADGSGLIPVCCRGIVFCMVVATAWDWCTGCHNTVWLCLCRFYVWLSTHCVSFVKYMVCMVNPYVCNVESYSETCAVGTGYYRGPFWHTARFHRILVRTSGFLQFQPVIPEAIRPMRAKLWESIPFQLWNYSCIIIRAI